MAQLDFDKDIHDLQREEELDDRKWLADREDSKQAAKYAHELELARVKQAVPQRHKTLVRLGLAFVKLPVLIVLAVMLPLLTAFGKTLPEPLTDFMSL